MCPDKWKHGVVVVQEVPERVIEYSNDMMLALNFEECVRSVQAKNKKKKKAYEQDHRKEGIEHLEK
jgi:hypothetical protein